MAEARYFLPLETYLMKSINTPKPMTHRLISPTKGRSDRVEPNLRDWHGHMREWMELARGDYVESFLTVLVTFSPSLCRNTISPNPRCDQPSVSSVRASEAKMTPVASSSSHVSNS